MMGVSCEGLLGVCLWRMHDENEDDYDDDEPDIKKLQCY